ncbi:hypothetical protein Tco_1497504, partial [Tanacetum coccineum]
DPEEDPADYPADEGDDDDEEEEKEASKEDDEEEGHLAPVDSTLPAIDSVPSVEETKPFETDESAATPPPPPISPRIVVPLSSTRLRRAQIFVQPHTPPSPSTKALILNLVESCITIHLPSTTAIRDTISTLTITITTLVVLPSADRRSDIPEADMPSRKRLCLTALTSRFEVGESSATVAARQTGLNFTYGTDYGIIDTLNASI